MTSARDLYTLYLCGPVRLIGPDGLDLTPRSKRSLGLLVLLGCSAGNEKPRRWLEQMLWSQRSLEQASASFRQVLVDIRKTLGHHREIIGSDRQNVWLNTACCDISFSAYHSAELEQSSTVAEGLYISDPAFTQWLLDIRNQFESTATAKGGKELNKAELSRRDNSIYLMSANTGNQDASRITEFVRHQIALKLRNELAWQARVQFPDEDVYLNRTRALELKTFSTKISEKTAISVELIDLQTRRQVWNDIVYSYAESHEILNDLNIYRLTNTSSEQIAKLMLVPGKRGNNWITAIVDKLKPDIFSFESPRLLAANELLQKATENRSHPLLEAWQAFAKMVLYVEQIQTTEPNKSEQKEEYPEFVNLDDKTNSQILALWSFVELFKGENLDVATRLALDAVAANPNGALSTLSLANIQLRKGEYAKASANAEKAASFESNSSFQHWWYMTCCLARVASGDYVGAIKYGEYTNNLAPYFRPPLRHLYALYLERQDYDNAKKTIISLRSMEPQFSLQMIRDSENYPANILRRSSLIDLNDINGLDLTIH